jgi:hypothetical protein
VKRADERLDIGEVEDAVAVEVAAGCWVMNAATKAWMSARSRTASKFRSAGQRPPPTVIGVLGFGLEARADEPQDRERAEARLADIGAGGVATRVKEIDDLDGDPAKEVRLAGLGDADGVVEDRCELDDLGGVLGVVAGEDGCTTRCRRCGVSASQRKTDCRRGG